MSRKKKKEEFIVRESSERYISDEEIITVIEKRLPELIKKRPSLRDGLRDILKDVFVGKEEIVLILNELRLQRESSDRRFEEMLKRFEAIDKRFEAVDKRFEEMREDMNRRFEEMREDMNRRFEEMREDMNARFKEVYGELKLMREDFHNAISSIGGRWGRRAEKTFREGMREILQKYFKAEVKEFYIEDREGIVKGRPGRYQIDLLITDSCHIIIEVKAQANDMDVNKLHKLGMAYEKQTGVKPRLILLTPFAREEAWEEAETVEDVEILTTPRGFKP